MIDFQEMCKMTNEVLNKYLNPQNIQISSLLDNFDNYVNLKEACQITKRSKKLLIRLFKLFDLDIKEKDSKLFFNKDDLQHLNDLKKPKGMKAIGLGNIHKAVIDRLKRKNIEIELEKRFDNFNLPFDIYIPKNNLTIEIQGPQHFFLSTNWCDNDIEKAKDLLKNQIERDNAKIKFCEDHKINHIWITEDSDVEDLFLILDNKLPEKNLKWLQRKHPDFSVYENNYENWLIFAYKKDIFIENLK